ncbi:transposon Tf2-1 polyprotein isoform X1 [Cucumis melo var. makuwa]|uniref:Transposon Tf2-1 polyprotein isoform X1 n=1 Tax=Cucumis melo var. makuwa TaxID=1194695 RepID=A0A5D3BQJ3_CUCMM|nr:transposon Tf2-1 polyprotein isoform X1 [Cucumis melo var. makuwa]
MLTMMMETIAKDRTAVGEQTTESAARESAVGKGKESEATSSKAAESNRNLEMADMRRKQRSKKHQLIGANLKRSKCRCSSEMIQIHGYSE